MRGLKSELEKEASQYSRRRQLVLVEEIKESLKDAKNPGDFLEKTVDEKKKKIRLFRNLRIVAFAFIAVMLLLRLALNISERTNK